MKQGMLKRLDALEARQVTALRLEDQRSERQAAIHDAMVIGNALRLGGNAREELDVADASLNPGRRAELTKRLDLARSIASALEKYSPRRETPTNARTIIPGTLDALLAAVI